MLSGGCLEDLVLCCIFMQYVIRPVLIIKSQSMPVAQKLLRTIFIIAVLDNACRNYDNACRN